MSRLFAVLIADNDNPSDIVKAADLLPHIRIDLDAGLELLGCREVVEISPEKFYLPKELFDHGKTQSK